MGEDEWMYDLEVDDIGYVLTTSQVRNTWDTSQEDIRDEDVWVTREGNVVEWGALETKHLGNIIGIHNGKFGIQSHKFHRATEEFQRRMEADGDRITT